MSLVWPLLDITAAEKLALMRVCDRAGDDGAHVFQSLDRMALEIGIEGRSMRRIYRRLEALSFIELVSEAEPARHRAREYRVNVPALKAASDAASAAMQERLKGLRSTRASSRRKERNAARGGHESPPQNAPANSGMWGTVGSPRGGHEGPHVGDADVLPTSIEQPSLGTAILSLVADATAERVPAAEVIASRSHASKRKTAKGSVSWTAETRAAFHEFWATYPKRVARGGAESAFLRALKSGASVAEILLGARRYAAKVKADRTEPRFIAHGTTWLNQMRWSDEEIPALAGLGRAKRTLADVFAEDADTVTSGTVLDLEATPAEAP